MRQRDFVKQNQMIVYDWASQSVVSQKKLKILQNHLYLYPSLQGPGNQLTIRRLIRGTWLMTHKLVPGPLSVTRSPRLGIPLITHKALLGRQLRRRGLDNA